MISRQKINELKRKREVLIHKLGRAEKEGEEDDVSYYKRRLHCLDLEERDAWKEDLVQPNEDKYKILYKKEWLEMEKRKELAEIKNKEDKLSKDKFYKDNILEGKARVMRALELEDKL